MTVAQNERDRGVKGLEGLVSELNLARITQALETPSHSQGESSAPSAAPQSNAPQRLASSPSRNRDYGRWPQAALIIGGVIVVVVLAVNSNDNKPSGYSTVPNTTNTGISAPPSRPVHTASPVESMPAVGTDRTLTGSELTYCVAQDARITAVQPEVNHNSDKEIKGFNEHVADFNSRCGNFRYYEDEMRQVRALVDGRHDEIAKQAQMWLANWRKGKRLTTSGLASSSGRPARARYSQSNLEDSTASTDDSEDADSEDKPKEEEP